MKRIIDELRKANRDWASYSHIDTNRIGESVVNISLPTQVINESMINCLGFELCDYIGISKEMYDDLLNHKYSIVVYAGKNTNYSVRQKIENEEYGDYIRKIAALEDDISDDDYVGAFTGVDAIFELYANVYPAVEYSKYAALAKDEKDEVVLADYNKKMKMYEAYAKIDRKSIFVDSVVVKTKMTHALEKEICNLIKCCQRYYEFNKPGVPEDIALSEEKKMHQQANQIIKYEAINSYLRQVEEARRSYYHETMQMYIQTFEAE